MSRPMQYKRLVDALKNDRPPPPVHMTVGSWASQLCHEFEGRTVFAAPRCKTLLREFVTCPKCLVLFDTLEESGKVKTELRWVRWGRRGEDDERDEAMWPKTRRPSERYKREAREQGFTIERRPVFNLASLRYYLKSLKESHHAPEEITRTETQPLSHRT